jgi:hypothetical protein
MILQAGPAAAPFDIISASMARAPIHQCERAARQARPSERVMSNNRSTLCDGAAGMHALHYPPLCVAGADRVAARVVLTR